MSPEQAAGDRDVDARSDIYALGAVTYEMLAGEPPVTGATVQAMIAKLMTERPTSLRILRDTVSPAVDSAVMRALAKAPIDRFATAHEFSDALVSNTGVTAQSPPRASATRWKLPVLAAGLLIFATAAILHWRRGVTGEAAPAGVIRSIAVLPLDNYSADSTQDYFAEGMTDELTSDLATISQLRVTSRGSATQFKGKSRPPTPEIAKALNVDAIVEGSVTRSGDRVRITAQLIDARGTSRGASSSIARVTRTCRRPSRSIPATPTCTINSTRFWELSGASMRRLPQVGGPLHLIRFRHRSRSIWPRR